MQWQRAEGCLERIVWGGEARKKVESSSKKI